MKTFDYEQVTAVIQPLKAKFDDCAHGEGDACVRLDKQMDCCAAICLEAAEQVVDWAHNVFAGEVAFDPVVENVWRTELQQIHSRAIKLWMVGRRAETPCWELPAQDKLASALWRLNWLLDKWVTPQLAVGPAARVKLHLTDEQRSAIQKQLSSLPPEQKRMVKR
jgi:hypothetical protein